MSTKPSTALNVSRRTLVIALVVVATLLVTILVAGEAYARHAVSRCISSQFEKEMGSQIDVGFGAKPMLITWFDGKVSSVTVDSKDNKFGPAVGMVVHAKFNDLEGVNNAQGGGSVGSSSANVTWSNEGIEETLGGMVSGVRSSSSTGMITLDVLGGLAQLQVHPEVRNGVVEVQTKSAELLGIGLPTDLVEGIVDLMTQSLQSYPMGLKATEIEVTDNGVAVQLAGGHTQLPAADNNADMRC
ncbi:LmeA family phospholipid-binding protein [Nocardia xishanensis]